MGENTDFSFITTASLDTFDPLDYDTSIDMLSTGYFQGSHTQSHTTYIPYTYSIANKYEDIFNSRPLYNNNVFS